MDNDKLQHGDYIAAYDLTHEEAHEIMLIEGDFDRGWLTSAGCTRNGKRYPAYASIAVQHGLFYINDGASGYKGRDFAMGWLHPHEDCERIRKLSPESFKALAKNTFTSISA